MQASPENTTPDIFPPEPQAEPSSPPSKRTWLAVLGGLVFACLALCVVLSLLVPPLLNAVQAVKTAQNPPTSAPTAAIPTPSNTQTAAAQTAVPLVQTLCGVTEANASLPQSEQEVKAGIQDALDSLAEAYNSSNPDLLTRAVDQTNAPFRRFVKTRFDTYQKSINAGSYRFRFTVTELTPKQGGFVVAHLLLGEGYAAACWPFRLTDDGRWVLSEPAVEQVGAKQTVEADYFTFETYPWADDVNGQIMALTENAAQRVQRKLGLLPEAKTLVKVEPIYGLEPFGDPGALAWYERASAGRPDTIKLYTPYAYPFGYFPVGAGWQKILEDVLTHEYTHMVHNTMFADTGKLMDWFGEGLAEFVSDSDRIYEVADAVRQEQLIPIIDPDRKVNQQDLMHIYLLEKDVSLAYAEAQSLIVYIYDTYGGMDAVWKVARTHDDLQDFDQTLQQALGVTYAEFDQSWRSWLKQNYAP